MSSPFGRPTHYHLFGGHICGLHFLVNHERRYLPQVQLTSKTTVNPISFTTELSQVFHNPNSAPISQLRYTFPLYDGVAVCGYTISYADKTLTGTVKQKDVAKQTYQAAVDRGETAGLLESLPAGVFGVTLGNVPANTDINVKITYCGELKHDATIDGLRFTLPTSIAPRYGDYPGQVLTSNVLPLGGIRINVDFDMGKSAIRKIQSPTHPIALTMGEMYTEPSLLGGGGNKPYNPSHATVGLSQGSAELSGDFVVQVVIDDLSKPQSILEVHPTLPNQRAILTTLVPKFVLPSAHPEIVFIADQSGSMGGSKNTSLVAALKVFLKSLPLGVRFNICAFGSDFKYLWSKSQAYSEANLNAALAFVDGFNASYGGTEMFRPIEAAFKNRLKDMPLEVMLLTDGEIWGEDQVFQYITDQIHNKKVDARVFALGIGQDVSHTLVEGVARAGNGFAQFVTSNEDTDQKVVRMLKGALYAHTTDYELEVHYADNKDPTGDDEFEIVEKVNDCLVIKEISDASSTSTKSTTAKIKSFFDTSADLDKPVAASRGADRYAHLPTLDVPKVVQAPAAIPPLFPFNRTTAYLLLGPESAQKEVTSVTLRAKSASGPLELEIPISSTTQGTSIHQLAARKAIQDLEEGRGWLQSATVSGTAKTKVKTKYESRFDEIVEREAVRLGERFQVASKWTSFVAVEDRGSDTVMKEIETTEPQLDADMSIDLDEALPVARRSFGFHALQRKAVVPSRSGAPAPAPAPGFGQQAGGLFGGGPPTSRSRSGFGSVKKDKAISASSYSSSGTTFGASSLTAATQSASLFGAPSMSAAPPPPSCALFGSASSFANSSAAEMEDDDEEEYSLLEAKKESRPSGAYDPTMEEGHPRARKFKKGTGGGSVLHEIIALQTFSGTWDWSPDLLRLVGVDDSTSNTSGLGGDSSVAATVLAIAYLETKLAEKKDVWEMVVEKARTALLAQMDGKKLEQLVSAAVGMVGKY